MNTEVDEQKHAASEIIDGDGYTYLKGLIDPDRAHSIRAGLLEKIGAAR